MQLIHIEHTQAGKRWYMHISSCHEIYFGFALMLRLLSQLQTHSCEKVCMYITCTQNVDVIKTTVSLKNKIKEKITFCGLTLYSK